MDVQGENEDRSLNREAENTQNPLLAVDTVLGRAAERKIVLGGIVEIARHNLRHLKTELTAESRMNAKFNSSGVWDFDEGVIVVDSRGRSEGATTVAMARALGAITEEDLNTIVPGSVLPEVVERRMVTEDIRDRKSGKTISITHAIFPTPLYGVFYEFVKGGQGAVADDVTGRVVFDREIVPKVIKASPLPPIKR